MDDLRNNSVDILTIGQYLQPTKKNIEVKGYIVPENLNIMQKAKEKGFIMLLPPIGRSSYLAERFLLKILLWSWFDGSKINIQGPKENC